MFRKTVLTMILSAAALPVLAGTPGVDACGEVRLHRHERIARADGVVTHAERYRLHRHADRMSGRIYRQKHDRQER